jgi:RNA polymerase-binding transcription factor DksA
MREEELARLRSFRRDEAQDAVAEPTDNLEVARSGEELELHAGLVALSEDRLNQLHEAFERLDEGRYGICGACGQEIPIERLIALPLALNCAGCESRQPRRELGKLDEQSLQRWEVPEGMVESLGKDDVLAAPRETARAVGSEPSFAPSLPSAKRPARSRKKPKPR